MNGVIDYTVNIRGHLISLGTPRVMGVLNATPDSFYAGSRKQTESEIAERANQIIAEDGTIIDIGAFSTRPGAVQITEQEEMDRLRFGLSIVRKEQPEAIVSIDTFRANVAQMCVEEYGADIINDVSEGGITGVAGVPMEQTEGNIPAMFLMVARLNVPYILMSVQATLREMMISFANKVAQLHSLGVKDIILDPGYGFGKTLKQNYLLLSEMDKLKELHLPILAGVSRKSMIYKLLDGDPSSSLNGTTVLNTISVLKGANILRVHDVHEAVEVVKICNQL